MAPTGVSTNLPRGVNFTQLAANAVVPTNGNNYQVVNLGFGHWLDNSASGLKDGNPVLSWKQDVPERSNQIWTYLTYPSSDGSTVFTLQALSTVQSRSNSVIDGRGGYLRVDQTSNKLVHGGQPQAWKLTQAAPQVYKLSPFENIFSFNGRLVATDMSSTIKDTSTNQAQLQLDITALEQLWTFNKL